MYQYASDEPFLDFDKNTEDDSNWVAETINDVESLSKFQNWNQVFLNMKTH